MENETKDKKTILSFIISVAGLVAIASMFFPFIVLSKNGYNSGSYTGFEVAFGYSNNYVTMNTNVVLVIAMVLTIVAILVSFFFYKNKFANLVCAILYIASAVDFLFISLYAKSVGQIFIDDLTTISAAYGAIFSGILSLFAGAGSIYLTVLCCKEENKENGEDKKEKKEKPNKKEDKEEVKYIDEE